MRHVVPAMLDWKIAAATSFLFLPTLAVGQEQAWTYKGSLYGWFTGIDASVETAVGTIEKEIDFSEVFDSLNMAVFGSFEARMDRLFLLADLNYSQLSSTAPTPVGIAFSEANVGTELTILSGYVGYSVIDRANFRVDLGGGINYFNADMNVNLTGVGAIADRSFDKSNDWVDASALVRVHAPLSEDWFFTGTATAGGFGLGDSSDLNWQALATLGYRFSETWSIQAGYRYLFVERGVIDLALHGPILGFSARF